MFFSVIKSFYATLFSCFSFGYLEKNIVISFKSFEAYLQVILSSNFRALKLMNTVKATTSPVSCDIMMGREGRQREGGKVKVGHMVSF